MLFNSVPFAIFLPVVFLLYWFVFQRSLRLQNLFVLAASYFFYAWWDWRFLSLIVLSSATDYGVGLALAASEDARRRRLLLGLSLTVNLGCLAFFKYFGFFVSSLVDAAGTLGILLEPTTLQIVLPVGISFYTFQTLSYTLDIHRGRIEATRDALSFFAFVSFFPQLVAGPIERAASLLPQFEKSRRFDFLEARDGARQILWGSFKKVVIADTCGRQVNLIFAVSGEVSGSTLLLGALYFAFQIYCDFSGYSDVAIGSAKLLGIRLRDNFDLPYFSRDVAEFWRRWHISLSSWFRDYVYIPLGGNRSGKARQVANVLLTFGLSGLWHGASWNFVVWGLLHGSYQIPSILRGRPRPDRRVAAWATALPRPGELARILATFALTLFAWIFFRAEDLGHALQYTAGLFTASLFDAPQFDHGVPLALIAGLLSVEWAQRRKTHPLQFDGLPVFLRWSVYLALSLAVIAFFGERHDFIYFQF